MELNWTIASVIGLISLIPNFAIVVVVSYYYIKQRYRYILLLNLTFLCFFLYNLMQELAFLTLNPFLYTVGNFCFLPGAFFLILSFDSIARESVDPKKIYLLLIVSVVAMVVALDPAHTFVGMYPNGEMGIFVSDLLMVLSGNVSFIVVGLFLYYAVRIYRNAPASLKTSARFFLGGALVLGIGMASVFSLAYVIDIQAAAPGLIYLITAIAAVFLGIALAREPKLAYLLPFRVIRLTVIEVHKGIALFTHTWSQQETLADKDLFSGMLQGISSLLDESLKKGSVREIYLEEAVIIIEESRKFPVACVLIATKSTRSLREALASFSKRFFTKFAPNFAMPSDISQFDPAITLVADRFSFIPEYD